MKPRKVKFPFKSRLSLKPLLDFWERLLAEGKYGLKSWGRLCAKSWKTPRSSGSPSRT